EDVCGPNHLPGYEHVEELSRLLVDVALEEGKLAISNSTRQRVIAAWNGLHLHDRSIHQFDSLHSARWGNALFGRTNGDPAESSLVQKLKFSKRRSAAHLLGSRKNRLMYCFVKQLWLHPHCRVKAGGLPQKHLLTTLHQRVQKRVTVDDAELSKLGILILKINILTQRPVQSVKSSVLLTDKRPHKLIFDDTSPYQYPTSTLLASESDWSCLPFTDPATGPSVWPIKTHSHFISP
ncbi:hypothetical protein D4764_0276320, partial [Takifugu flavidus]